MTEAAAFAGHGVCFRGCRAMSRPLFKTGVLVAGIAAVSGWLFIGNWIRWLIAKL